MADEKKTAKAGEKAKETPAPQVEMGDHDSEVVISQWEFIEKVPTRDEVMALLETLPPAWGVMTVDYADYVQALPQKKKIKRPAPQNPNVMVDEYLNCYTLYMSVAGRLKMIEQAAEINGWQVDYEPELVDNGKESGRIVYRERVIITRHAALSKDALDPATPDWATSVPLGSKTGTAWVPYTGGSQAAGSNPYEKVETAARGRAIAAWGFGVLPGSGVASVEEMYGARQNRVAMDVEAAKDQGRNRPGNGTRKPREELIAEALTAAEELRQARGMTEQEMHERTVTYLTVSLGVKNVVDADGKVDWGKVKDGQIQLMTNALRTSLREFRDEGSQI